MTSFHTALVVVVDMTEFIKWSSLDTGLTQQQTLSSTCERTLSVSPITVEELCLALF